MVPMDNSTQAQAERWTTYKAPEFVSAEERTAYNQLRGILQLHPAEITANREFDRIRELVDTIERERMGK